MSNRTQHRLHPRFRLHRVLPVLVLTAGLLVGGAEPVLAARASAPAPVSAALITYLAYVNGIEQVFTMKSDGTAKTQVTSNAIGPAKCDPALSPTVGRPELAYASSGGGMWVHDLNTGVAVDIAPPVEADFGRGGGRRPAWSATGDAIVYSYTTNNRDTAGVDTPAAEQTYDLWMVRRVVGDARNPDRWTSPERITKLEGGQAAYHARFRHGDTAGAGKHWFTYNFRQSVGATPELYVVQLDPASLPLASFGVPVGKNLGLTGKVLSTWSKSGAQLAFASSCTGLVQVSQMTYIENVWTVSPPRDVAQSTGCGVAFSRGDENLILYGDSSRIYVKDISTTARAKQVGVGNHPNW